MCFGTALLKQLSELRGNISSLLGFPAQNLLLKTETYIFLFISEGLPRRDQASFQTQCQAKSLPFQYLRSENLLSCF